MSVLKISLLALLVIAMILSVIIPFVTKGEDTGSYSQTEATVTSALTRLSGEVHDVFMTYTYTVSGVAYSAEQVIGTGIKEELKEEALRIANEKKGTKTDIFYDSSDPKEYTFYKTYSYWYVPTIVLVLVASASTIPVAIYVK